MRTIIYPLDNELYNHKLSVHSILLPSSDTAALVDNHSPRRQALVFLPSQRIEWWWHGDDRSQGTRSHGINSANARDGIFRLNSSIPCLLMPRLLTPSGYHQAWYWYRIDNLYDCSVVNLVFCSTKVYIWFETYIHLWKSLKQFSMLKVQIVLLDLSGLSTKKLKK